jgi:hypothetical protein
MLMLIDPQPSMTWRQWWDAMKEQWRDPETVAKRWETMGREWAIMGCFERSRWCHAHAAWHRRPWWGKVFGDNPGWDRPTEEDQEDQ